MIKSHIIENEFLRIKTINFGATLFEVFYKPKKTNLILNLDKIQSYKKNQILNLEVDMLARYAYFSNLGK